MAYRIINRQGRCVDGRTWKRKEDVKRHIKAILRNNSLKQRQTTGYIGLKLRKVKGLYDREKKELKGADKFIWN
jgi:hypothetical protein